MNVSTDFMVTDFMVTDLMVTDLMVTDFMVRLDLNHFFGTNISPTLTFLWPFETHHHAR